MEVNTPTYTQRRIKLVKILNVETKRYFNVEGSTYPYDTKGVKKIVAEVNQPVNSVCFTMIPVEGKQWGFRDVLGNYIQATGNSSGVIVAPHLMAWEKFRFEAAYDPCTCHHDLVDAVYVKTTHNTYLTVASNGAITHANSKNPSAIFKIEVVDQ